ncbi:MAG: GntR family transcriptional regulator [Spirochaetes bacterium]|nr:GntR family transcriptional regulator [Spirochaetota bacterium]
MEKIQKDILGELVYHNMKAMIADNVLKPGNKIINSEVAKVLGVSQTPIRDAINRLLGEGLVEQKKGGGFFVKKFSLADLKEFYAIRAALEGMAIRLYIEKLNGQAPDEELISLFNDFSYPIEDEQTIANYFKKDKKFHGKIIELSGNSVITAFNESFGFILKSYQQGLLRNPNDTLSEHLAIIEAIKNRDAVLAHELIVNHHLKTRENMDKI